MWAGLGYYRRARYLLEGAQFIVDKLGGTFPETAAGVRPCWAFIVGAMACLCVCLPDPHVCAPGAPSKCMQCVCLEGHSASHRVSDQAAFQLAEGVVPT